MSVLLMFFEAFLSPTSQLLHRPLCVFMLSKFSDQIPKDHSSFLFGALRNSSHKLYWKQADPFVRAVTANGAANPRF